MRGVILLALALAGCTNKKERVLVSDVCTRGHYTPYSYVTFMPAGKSMIPITHTGSRFDCDHYMHVVRPNPDYISTTDKED